MKCDINYISLKHYPTNKIMWWVFYFKKYVYIKGVIIRIFGFNFNIRENDGTKKLIEQLHKKASIAQSVQ